MPFIWTTSPQLPSPPIPEQIPSGAISSKVDLVANTVNAGGVLVYNTAAEAYEVVYPTSNGGGTVQLSNTFEHINVTFANLTHITSNTINASSANITTIMSTSANIGLLYYPTIVNGNVSSDPNTPLGIASKQYVDNAIISATPQSRVNVGTINKFSQLVLPPTHLVTNAASVSSTQYANLYSHLGIIHGEGDGNTTFGVPYLQGSIVGWGENNLTTFPQPLTKYASCITSNDVIVVIAGANNNSSSMSNTFLGFNYKNTNISWVETNNFPQKLINGRVITLHNGQLFFAGGTTQNNSPSIATYMGDIVANTITWTPSNSLPSSLSSFSMQQLSDNRLLLIGGGSDSTYFGTITGGSVSWVSTNTFPTTIQHHTSHQLSDNSIWVSLGQGSINTPYRGVISSNNIVWEPSTPYLTGNHSNHGSVVLNDGRIFLTLGNTISAQTWIGSQISGNVFSWVQGMSLPIEPHPFTMIKLSGGQVVLNINTGNQFGNYVYLGSISSSNQNTIIWSSRGSANTELVTLSDGRILYVGGFDGHRICAQTWFGSIVNSSIQWIEGTSFPYPIQNHTTTYLHDKRILVVGGSNSSGSSLNGVYFGNIAGNTITWSSTNAYPLVIASHSSTLLSKTNQVIVVGGFTTGVSDNVYIGDITSNSNIVTWTQHRNLPVRKYKHSASIVNGGNLLVVGGLDASSVQTRTCHIAKIGLYDIKWEDTTQFPVHVSSTKQILHSSGKIYIQVSNGTSSIIYSGHNSINPFVIFWKEEYPYPAFVTDYSICELNDRRLLIHGGSSSGLPVRSDSYICNFLTLGIKT